MQRRERHALLLLFSVAALGHGVRYFRNRPEEPAGAITLVAGASTDALARHRAESARLGRPLATGERIDLNQATAQEIARLPRVGTSLARAIVRDRETNGSYQALNDLDRVSGVGAGLLTLIAPHVVQSLDTTRSRSAAGRTTAGRAVATQPAAPRSPSIPVVRVPTVRMVREQPKRGGKAAGPIDLNSASENDLMTLAGIGPARARAIVAFRQKNGPFASVAELEKVPGITPKLRRRLEAQVVVR